MYTVLSPASELGLIVSANQKLQVLSLVPCMMYTQSNVLSKAMPFALIFKQFLWYQIKDIDTDTYDYTLENRKLLLTC